MGDREVFLASLGMLAEFCGRTLTREILALYEKHLKEFGYAAVSRVLEDMTVNRGSRDPFPSIREIRERLNPPENPDHEAIEASNRIVEAISRFGFYREPDAREFIGELGWLVVQREGGWTGLCERVMSDQLPILKAQWRELAKALQARSKAGRLESAPALPKPVNRTADLVRIGEIMPKRNGGMG